MLHGLVDVAAAGIKDFKYIVVGVGVVNVMIDLTKQITEDDGEFTPGDAIHLVVNMIEVAIPEVGLADFHQKNGFNFSIIPNPNTGIFKIELSSNENVPGTISILSPIGTEFKKIETTNKITLLDLATLSNGIYLVVVMEGNKKVVKKLIINK